MSLVTNYHITFEDETHIGEAEVEVSYAMEENPFGQDEASYRGENDGYEPAGEFQFFDIIITEKATGLSEEVDEMPSGMLCVARDQANESFEV